MASRMLLHCGGEAATLQDVGMVPLPEATATYRPVPHLDIDRLLRREVGVRFPGLGEPECQYGMNNQGRQLFATHTYEVVGADGHPLVDLGAFDLDPMVLRDHGYAIGWRNSYDLSMSLAVVGGSCLFLCDNLAIHGSDFNIILKHTPRVWERVVPSVMQRVEASFGQWLDAVRLQEGLKQAPLAIDRGYELIGLAIGHGVLTMNQTSIAVKEWTDTHRVVDHTFAPWGGTGFALYQAFTQALKLGSVQRKLDRYVGVSELFEAAVLPPKPVAFQVPAQYAEVVDLVAGIDDDQLFDRFEE